MIRNQKQYTCDDQTDSRYDQQFRCHFNEIRIHDPDDSGRYRSHNDEKIHFPITIRHQSDIRILFLSEMVLKKDPHIAEEIPQHQKEFCDHPPQILKIYNEHRDQCTDMQQHVKQHSRFFYME